MDRRSTDPTEPPEGFIRRWSRLKQEAEPRDRAPAPVVVPPTAREEHDEGATPAVDVPNQPEANRPPELPPIETLTRDSDYSVFMQPDVPDDLRRQALRKLWASDPLFAQIDTAEAYCGDYNAVPIFPEGVRTAYKVGKGFVDAIEEIASAVPPTSDDSPPEKEMAADISAKNAAQSAADSGDETSRAPRGGDHTSE
jgi:hypothetical protein